MAIATRERHCVRCGKSEDDTAFRSPQAMKCVNCDESTEEERREYHRLYHKARGMAVKELIARHSEEFERLRTKARRKLEREEEKAVSAA